MRDDRTYIRTYSGGKFWPLEPEVGDVKIEDIAHALSQQCRWTGHTNKFYSVAQHCCLVSDQLPYEHQLAGLLHDASEAYLSDISRPVKHSPGFGEVYKVAEARLESVIASAFNVDYPWAPPIKDADNLLLHSEGRDLLNFTFGKTEEEASKAGEKKYLPVTIEPWSPEKAEQEYLDRFRVLTLPMSFTTGEYAKARGIHRHTALSRLTKMEGRGIVERVRVKQNQGGIIRPDVLGWRLLGDSGSIESGSSRSGSFSGKTAEAVVTSVTAGNSGGGGSADVPSGGGTTQGSSFTAEGAAIPFEV